MVPNRAKHHMRTQHCNNSVLIVLTFLPKISQVSWVGVNLLKFLRIRRVPGPDLMITAQKMKFPIKYLVKFIKEIFNGKPHFCAVDVIYLPIPRKLISKVMPRIFTVDLCGIDFSERHTTRM